jgi:hypothetical protein
MTDHYPHDPYIMCCIASSPFDTGALYLSKGLVVQQSVATSFWPGKIKGPRREPPEYYRGGQDFVMLTPWEDYAISYKRGLVTPKVLQAALRAATEKSPLIHNIEDRFGTEERRDA